MDTIARRLELLRLEGLGFSQAEIVAQLSQKDGCSKRTVYLDFENRKDWQPILQSMLKGPDILMKVVNRYEQIYRGKVRMPLEFEPSPKWRYHPRSHLFSSKH